MADEVHDVTDWGLTHGDSSVQQDESSLVADEIPHVLRGVTGSLFSEVKRDYIKQKSYISQAW